MKSVTNRMYLPKDFVVANGSHTCGYSITMTHKNPITSNNDIRTSVFIFMLNTVKARLKYGEGCSKAKRRTKTPAVPV
jgi:hypothetical protein